MTTVYLDGESLTIEQVEQVARHGARVELDPCVQGGERLCARRHLCRVSLDDTRLCRATAQTEWSPRYLLIAGLYP